MAKEVAAFIKLQIKGGAANPSPPVGPALGSKGVNIMDFCKQFNARTQDKAGKVLPVIITVYSDKSFDFVVKQPPVAIQLKEAAKVQKGSAQPNRDKVGQVTWDQVREIAQDKMPDMNCFTLEAAMRMIAGTARSGRTISDFHVDFSLSARRRAVGGSSCHPVVFCHISVISILDVGRQVANLILFSVKVLNVDTRHASFGIVVQPQFYRGDLRVLAQKFL